MSKVAASTYVGRVWGASLTDKVHYKTHPEREAPMTEPTYRLDRWQQDLADELARAERPPVTVADLRRMMGLPPTGETP